MSAERQITPNYLAKSATRVRRAVTELAERQHGVISLEQLRMLGVDDGTARYWVASGRLRRLHNGVFALGHKALRAEGHYMAAVLACGERAALSHRSAAALLDLRSSAAATADVTAAGRIGRSRKGIRVHSGDQLAADEIEKIDGIPCTSAARTMLDLAASLDRRGLEALVERAERIRVFDLFQVTRLIARHRGRRGVARLRAVLAEWDDDLMRCRSEPEVLFFRMVVRAGMERPVVNSRIEVGEMSPEVDFHWPRHRLIVELDSVAFHGNPLARKRDAKRDRALAGAGWRVQRFDYWDVTDHAPRTLQTVIRQLRSSDGRTAANAK